MEKHIAVFLPSLRGGGAERVFTNLSNELVRRGWKIDMVLVRAEGKFLSDVSQKVQVHDLSSPRTLRSLFRLREFLEARRPRLLVSALPHANLVALWAVAFSNWKMPVVLTEHNNLSKTSLHASRRTAPILPILMRCFYPRADAIVAVSSGVARELITCLRLDPERIQVIYNPIVCPNILRKADEPVSHPWLLEKRDKVILAAGRLTKQKGFDTLLRAFAVVRRTIPAKLIILGEGEERKSLHNLAVQLGIGDDVDMPGFADNPYSYMRAADVFVLSSRWEGLGSVLVEALAVGTAVVSTDCPHGPSEILQGGKLGRLCAVDDVDAMAKAILETLRDAAHPVDPSCIREFTTDRAVDQYVRLFQQLMR